MRSGQVQKFESPFGCRGERRSRPLRSFPPPPLGQGWAMAGAPAPPRPRCRVQAETRLVLEAFLQGRGGAGAPGHVGRSYHDPQRYAHRPLPEQASTPGGSLRPGSWTPLHEDINRVEERKHGFKTSVKKLLQRRASPRHSPPGPLPARGDSLKRQKGGEGEEGGRRRYPRSFSFKGLLRRKGLAREEQDPHPPPSPSSLRPTSLPVTPCYCTDLPALGQQDPTAQGQPPQDPALYAQAAQKLDKLLKQQQLNSPGSANGAPSPRLGARTPGVQLGIRHSAPTDHSSETASEQHREQVIQRLISLLEEQAEDINREMETDPVLRSTLSRMSFHGFSQLAEAFAARAPPSSPSPQLTRLALTMELTRRVAGISNHAVQTLMGYSLQRASWDRMSSSTSSSTRGRRQDASWVGGRGAGHPPPRSHRDGVAPYLWGGPLAFSGYIQLEGTPKQIPSLGPWRAHCDLLLNI
ncbi:bcl-2-like protein 12 isoform X2 [Alligator mississippiensis]|uniref:bcl-2-like protein 12 isoform X2 n=1 Tax=Alligator mississippiensis TaxID=8496 RepID=UPI0028778E83|nr:bcl-2-like protein 12 isoform X2 [Alligator mississippiensis]